MAEGLAQRRLLVGAHAAARDLLGLLLRHPHQTVVQRQRPQPGRRPLEVEARQDALADPAGRVGRIGAREGEQGGEESWRAYCVA